MRIIFVRHGEPDYSTDSLTENGKKEAEALAERTSKWNVDKFYVSPQGRAKETAAPTLKKMGREAVEYPWLREFSYRVRDKLLGIDHCAWDFMPQDYTSEVILMDPDNWYKAKLYDESDNLEKYCKEVYEGIDNIVAEYGYKRNGAYYDFVDPTGHVNPASKEDIMLTGIKNYEKRDEDDDKTIVIFCHFGVTSLMIAHLIGISPVALWHGTCIPPTGITIVNAEKRLNNAAHFRIQALGDVSHLLKAGLPVSGYAAFSTVFQQ